jgi:hypothetical protein
MIRLFSSRILRTSLPPVSMIIVSSRILCSMKPRSIPSEITRSHALPYSNPASKAVRSPVGESSLISRIQEGPAERERRFSDPWNSLPSVLLAEASDHSAIAPMITPTRTTLFTDIAPPSL